MVDKKGRTKPGKRSTGDRTTTPKITESTAETTAETTLEGGGETIGPIEPPPPPDTTSK